MAHRAHAPHPAALRAYSDVWERKVHQLRPVMAVPRDLRLNFIFRSRRSFVAFAVLLIIWPLLHHTRTYPLNADQVERIRIDLIAEYSRTAVSELTKGGHDRAGYTARAATLARLSNVEVKNTTAKGLLFAKYARAEIAVDGAPPPDGRAVRYFRFGALPSRLSSGWIEYHVFLW